MTDKQRRFCDEYLTDCNGARAYKAVYPSVKKDETARANSSRLLARADIKEYIKEQVEKLHNEKMADAKEVIEYLTAVMRGETSAAVLAVGVTGLQQVIMKPPDEKERLKAAELLGKYHAIFTDRAKVENSGVVQIVDDIK